MDRELEVRFLEHKLHLIQFPLNLYDLNPKLVLLVQSLRRDRVLRVFKLNTGQDDHAIMFLDDYLNQVG